jgi:hypothetical protein
MAEDLAVGNPIPLGKYLLGSVYHMLHQTTYLMHTCQKIWPLVVCSNAAAAIHASDRWY